MMNPTAPNSDYHISEPASQNRPSARRKRKPLSCTLCRRRKLACDREYPSCSRCRKTGKVGVCSYEDGPVRSNNGNKSEVAVPGQGPSVLKATPVLDNTTLPTALAEYTNIDGGGDAPVIIPSTSAQDRGTWQLTSATISAQRPAIKADVTELMHPHEPPSTEPVIFRGDGYMTQYYGSTNPTSLIAHVGCSCQ